ncbi:hypothetical protein LXA43DRAFT_976354 [Ganoderma leucocontextum]|nr:hypothetical protein LXA43DRAFT_976354 [Ganoderma leucocontextum]
MDETALKALDRKALQKLAKTNGIKANLKSNVIIKQLIAKQPSKRWSRRSPPRHTTATSRTGRRTTAQNHPQPDQSRSPRLRGDEDGSELARSASPEASISVRPSALSRFPRTQAPPPQSSSASPPPVASQRRLPSFEEHLSRVDQPQAGPSRTKPKAPTLGVFNEPSASRAPWPQELRNPPHRPPSSFTRSPPPGSAGVISNVPSFPPGTHPYSISTGIPKGFVFPSYHRPVSQAAGAATGPGTSASASASAPRRVQIVPEPGYRSRSPTPLEEYDSLRGVPLFPEPASDYEEAWTPYSSPGAAAAAGSSAQPAAGHSAARSPVFPLTRAVFAPPPRILAPLRSPVFHSPAVVPRVFSARVPDRQAVAGAVTEAEGEEEEYDGEEEEEEEEEDDGTMPATDEQLHGMVARLAMLARHQCAAQTGLDEITEDVNRLHRSAPRLRARLRQERASFQRMRAYLGHLNVRVEPEWDHAEIWDTACLLREDDRGNQIEVETSDEEEEEWREQNPLPPNARTTEIEMQLWTPWLPGVCEDEDRDNVLDIAAATEKYRTEHREADRSQEEGSEPAQRGEGSTPSPRTPKRRHDDDDDGGRAKKKVRGGSAGRTPPPKAFFRKGKKKGGKAGREKGIKTPPLVGIAEEDSSGEEDMEMTSVV